MLVKNTGHINYTIGDVVILCGNTADIDKDHKNLVNGFKDLTILDEKKESARAAKARELEEEKELELEIEKEEAAKLANAN